MGTEKQRRPLLTARISARQKSLLSDAVSHLEPKRIGEMGGAFAEVREEYDLEGVPQSTLTPLVSLLRARKTLEKKLSERYGIPQWGRAFETAQSTDDIRRLSLVRRRQLEKLFREKDVDSSLLPHMVSEAEKILGVQATLDYAHDLEEKEGILQGGVRDRIYRDFDAHRLISIGRQSRQVSVAEEDRSRHEEYETQRRHWDYNDFLGEDMYGIAAMLPEDSRILDLGGGRGTAGYTLLASLHATQKNPGGLTYTNLTKRAFGKKRRIDRPRLSKIDASVLEVVGDAETEKFPHRFNEVWDVWGAHFYSPRKKHLIEHTYNRLLTRPDDPLGAGTARIFLPGDIFEVRGKDGGKVPLESFFDDVARETGIELSWKPLDVKDTRWGRLSDPGVLTMKRTMGSNRLVLPVRQEVVEQRSLGVPKTTYRLLNESA